MIIQALSDLYERRAADSEWQGKIPLAGMGLENVYWELVLS